MDQIDAIWGLSPEVVQKVKEQFKVKALPSVKR